MMRYGEERMLQDCKEVGVNGFIMVDLPPEEAVRFRNMCTSYGWVTSFFFLLERGKAWVLWLDLLTVFN